MKRYCAAALALVLGCIMFTGCRRREPMPAVTVPATQPATHAATVPATQPATHATTEPTVLPTENTTRPSSEPTENNTTQPAAKARPRTPGME